jgi:hypothetical protein
MTLELDAGARTAPHGDPLRPRLELTVVSVPLMPELADAAAIARRAWDAMLDEVSPASRALIRIRGELDHRAVLGLNAPRRIVVGPETFADGITVWGLPVRLDPSLDPGEWRLEVPPAELGEGPG